MLNVPYKKLRNRYLDNRGIPVPVLKCRNSVYPVFKTLPGRYVGAPRIRPVK